MTGASLRMAWRHLDTTRPSTEEFTGAKLELHATSSIARSGFMRPLASPNDEKFLKEFDPLDTHQKGFIEGNAWNYSLYVPHEPDDLARMMGGQESASAITWTRSS
jgi:hypothetical protein